MIMVLLLCCLVSCNNNEFVPGHSYITKNVSGMDIRFIDLKIEKVGLDSAFISSMYGKTEVIGSSLYYLDTYNSYLYMLDGNGKICNRYLGVGNAPYEINCGPLAAHAFTGEGNLIIYGTSDDIYVYNTEFEIVNNASFRLKREARNGDPCSFETYTFPRFIVCRSYNEKTYINNNSSAYGFNYFETPEEYAKECRIITEYDIPNKRIGRLLGRGLPEIYHGTSDKNYIFSEFTFDIDNEGSFYVAFMADSLIYKFNQDFKPMEAFGYQGKDMDMDYLSVTNPKEIYTKANEQYESKGWYTWVEYIQEKDWVCRSYHKGGDSSSDGMQIYEDGKLIADLDVPVGFRPIGYIYPYIYSDIMTEGNSQVFYKINVE